RNGLFERVTQQEPHGFNQAFRDFQGYVADETITGDYINTAVVKITTFHVTDEVERQLLHHRERLARDFVALGLFLAHGKQTDRWLGYAEDCPEIDFAHNGELRQILWLGIYVSANIHQN